jgi:hypothetical protein
MIRAILSFLYMAKLDLGLVWPKVPTNLEVENLFDWRYNTFPPTTMHGTGWGEQQNIFLIPNLEYI